MILVCNFYDFRSEPYGIRVCDLNDLTKILVIASVAPRKPGVLCTGPSKSLLLYEYWTKSPREVCWLDLSAALPKPAAEKRVILPEQEEIRDMCFLHHREKELLITVDGDGKIYAYDTQTNKLEWKIDGKLPGMEGNMQTFGITSDGRGHLFAADYGNMYIQMFLVSDDQYLGYLIIDKEKLRSPVRVKWCEKLSSLLYINSWHWGNYLNAIM